MSGLGWFVDELVGFRDRWWIEGWAFDSDGPVTSIVPWLDGAPLEHVARIGLASPELVEAVHPAADAARFALSGALPEGRRAHELSLVVQHAGQQTLLTELFRASIANDPYHHLEARFSQEVGRGRVLEIGSRARSGHERGQRFDPEGYVGLDIVEGPGVDVVGDAHALSRFLPAAGFDAVFSVSVFEHLLMPWKVAVEINRVLVPGGWVFVGTHQSFPPHDVPWDYLRFSDEAWAGIFNASTGFEVVAAAMGEPASIVPLVSHEVTSAVERSPGHLLSGVLARKVGDATVDWDVPIAGLTFESYPH